MISQYPLLVIFYFNKIKLIFLINQNIKELVLHVIKFFIFSEIKIQIFWVKQFINGKINNTFFKMSLKKIENTF
jgi:hypothetical protein